MLVGEAYVHIDFSDDIEFGELAQRLESGIISLARDIYTRDVKIEYLLEGGTLIERARLFRAIAYIIGAVATYHEFRASVIDLYQDAQRFGNMAIEQFHDITDTKPSSVIYKRTIPKDVSRLYRIVQNTDRLQNVDHHGHEYQTRQEAIISDIAGLYASNPFDGGIQTVLDTFPRDKLPELPKTAVAAVEMNERRKRLTERPKGHAGLTGSPAEEVLERRRKRRYTHTTSI